MEQLINSNNILDYIFWGNSIKDWLIAFIIFIAVWIGLKIFKAVIISRLKKISQKTKTEIDDIVIGAIDSIHLQFYLLVSAYAGLQYLSLSEKVNKFAYYIFLIAVVYYAIKFASKLIDFGTKVIVKKREETLESTGIIRFMSGLLKVALWVIAIILLLSNLGYNVTSLIAGLGIGGVAVALALQNILGDLFSSLAIYLDKPFKIGDFIVVGDYMGTVEKVGIKTTRLQALQGEEIVIPNNELTNSKVQNFGVMKKRRIVFNIGVTYDTPKNKLEKIPNIIKEIIEKVKGAEIERIHFKSFGDFSLGYEIVYYVNSGEYVEYMDIQQEINLNIVEKFEKEKIEMAFPTQTVYVKK